TVVSEAGCTQDTTFNVVIRPAVIARLEKNILSDCSPMEVEFSDLSSAPAGSAKYWRINGNPPLPAMPSNLKYTFISTSITDTTFYNVKLIVQDPLGICRDTASVMIAVPPKP